MADSPGRPVRERVPTGSAPSKAGRGRERAPTGMSENETTDELREQALSIIVLGASGDLAKKKTFPALLKIWEMGLLPPHTRIFGYARSKLSQEDFVARIRPFAEKVTCADGVLDSFLANTTYVSGQYDSQDDFAALHDTICAGEVATGLPGGNRVFYLALPPSVFASVSATFKPVCMSTNGWNRVIVEVRFGEWGGGWVGVGLCGENGRMGEWERGSVGVWE